LRFEYAIRRLKPAATSRDGNKMNMSESVAAGFIAYENIMLAEKIWISAKKYSNFCMKKRVIMKP